MIPSCAALRPCVWSLVVRQLSSTIRELAHRTGLQALEPVPVAGPRQHAELSTSSLAHAAAGPPANRRWRPHQQHNKSQQQPLQTREEAAGAQGHREPGRPHPHGGLRSAPDQPGVLQGRVQLFDNPPSSSSAPLPTLKQYPTLQQQAEHLEVGMARRGRAVARPARSSDGGHG